MNIILSVIKDSEVSEYCGNVSITPHNLEYDCQYHLINQTQSDKFLSGSFKDSFNNLSSIITRLEEIVNSN